MCTRVWVLGLGLAFGVATIVSATEPDIKCESDKIKTAGKYTKCLMGTYSKAVKKGEPQDEKLAKCNLKYDKKWGKIEARAADKGPPFCPTSGDRDSIRDELIAQANVIAALLAGDPNAPTDPSCPACVDVAIADPCVEVIDPCATGCESNAACTAFQDVLTCLELADATEFAANSCGCNEACSSDPFGITCDLCLSQSAACSSEFNTCSVE